MSRMNPVAAMIMNTSQRAPRAIPQQQPTPARAGPGYRPPNISASMQDVASLLMMIQQMQQGSEKLDLLRASEERATGREASEQGLRSAQADYYRARGQAATAEDPLLDSNRAALDALTQLRRAQAQKAGQPAPVDPRIRLEQMEQLLRQQREQEYVDISSLMGPPSPEQTARMDILRPSLGIKDTGATDRAVPTDFDPSDPLAVLGLRGDFTASERGVLLRKALEGDQDAITQLYALQFLPQIAQDTGLPSTTREAIAAMLARLVQQANSQLGVTPAPAGQ